MPRAHAVDAGGIHTGLTGHRCRGECVGDPVHAQVTFDVGAVELRGQRVAEPGRQVDLAVGLIAEEPSFVIAAVAGARGELTAVDGDADGHRLAVERFHVRDTARRLRKRPTPSSSTPRTSRPTWFNDAAKYRETQLSAPTVGGLGRRHQRLAQLAQFDGVGAFLDRCGDILGGASDLVDAVGELSGLVRSEDDRVRGQRRALDHGALFVRALPARLPAVLPPPAQARIADLATAPAAGGGAKPPLDPGCHRPDCKPSVIGFPVSWWVESGTSQHAAALMIRTITR